MNSSLPFRVLFISGFLFLPALIASARVERVVEKNFSVSVAGTLRLETQGGEIRVPPSNDSAIKVTARQRFRTSSETEAEEILKKLDLVIEQNGDDVRAGAETAEQRRRYRDPSRVKAQGSPYLLRLFR